MRRKPSPWSRRAKIAIDDVGYYWRGFAIQEVKALYGLERNKP
jgi:hypothetical protein